MIIQKSRLKADAVKSPRIPPVCCKRGCAALDSELVEDAAVDVDVPLAEDVVELDTRLVHETPEGTAASLDSVRSAHCETDSSREPDRTVNKSILTWKRLPSPPSNST